MAQFAIKLSELSKAEFDTTSIRIVTQEDGTPYFNATDVCTALGFNNPRQAVTNHIFRDDVQKLDTTDSIGRTVQMTYINESGLYALIMGSILPIARQFQRWVTNEVLPAIRKTGRYEQPTASNVQQTENADSLDLIVQQAAALRQTAQNIERQARYMAQHEVLLREHEERNIKLHDT